MLFRGLDGLMAEQFGDFLQRDAILQEVHNECVPEPVTHHVTGFKILLT